MLPSNKHLLPWYSVELLDGVDNNAGSSRWSDGRQMDQYSANVPDDYVLHHGLYGCHDGYGLRIILKDIDSSYYHVCMSRCDR